MLQKRIIAWLCTLIFNLFSLFFKHYINWLHSCCVLHWCCLWEVMSKLWVGVIKSPGYLTTCSSPCQCFCFHMFPCLLLDPFLFILWESESHALIMVNITEKTSLLNLFILRKKFIKSDAQKYQTKYWDIYA